MLKSVKTYLYDRRKGLSKAAGFAGGAYLVGRYISERLEEVKERVAQERLARDKYALFNCRGTLIEPGHHI
jgi:peroxin-3